MNSFEAEWILRVLDAVAAGVGIGFERHNHAKEAGIRTHALVALGSCVLMLISKYGFWEYGNPDPARVAAQVVSGIGFLGAGIIFVRHEVIQGLTTAAGIWTTSAMGMCFGAGMYELGFICFVTMFIIQIIFKKIFVFNAPKTSIYLKIYMQKDATGKDVSECLKNIGYSHTENTITSDGSDGWIMKTEIFTLRDIAPQKIVDSINALPCVYKVEVV